LKVFRILLPQQLVGFLAEITHGMWILAYIEFATATWLDFDNVMT
jgi:hypothetical protein